MYKHRSSLARRMFTAAYFGFCLILVAVVFIDAWTFYYLLDNSMPYLIVLHQACGALLNYLELGIFALFLRSIKDSPSIFSKRQPIYLSVLGVCLLLETLYGTWTPVGDFPAKVTLANDVSLIIESPELDLSLLLFAIFFFCLAAVFKYGAELQEDSDSIL